MPYVPKRTTVGFEPIYNVAGFKRNPVPYLLKTNTAFEKGMLVGMTLTGVAEGGAIFPWTNSTRSDQNAVVGVMAEDVAQADNPSAENTYGLVYDSPFQVYRVTFVPGINGDVAVSSGNTTSMVTATSFTEDHRAAGSTIFFYEGPGSPAIRRLSDSTGSTNTLTWLEPLATAVTTDTKFVLLGVADLDTAGGGIGIGSFGLTVNSDSKRINGDAAPHVTQQPAICVGLEMELLAMHVMFQGMLLGR